MKVLVTGGAGYIGSHTVVALIEKGHVPVIVDNLSNSDRIAVKRVEQITGQEIEFHEFDICDSTKTSRLISDENFEAIIHFAGYKAVGESVRKPVEYFQNNIDSTIQLLKAINAEQSTNPPKFIFSSSATVYGAPEHLPIDEDAPTGVGITNPYGFTKFACEQLLKDTSAANSKFQSIALRYFNPIGAHPSGSIGEDPSGIPNNLAPYVTQVASGKLESVSVFGDDYDTPDGTGIRDYIHVMDLAEGHVAALGLEEPGFHALNLGTGKGTSVLELIRAFEKAADKEIPYKISPRRPGDIAASYAGTQKAKKLLKWQTRLSIQDACEDSWNWQKTNPTGYKN